MAEARAASCMAFFTSSPTRSASSRGDLAALASSSGEGAAD